MFRCAITKQITKPGVPMTRVVVETRPKTYVNWVIDPETLEKVKVVSVGHETVSEIQVSPEGMAILMKEVEGA